MKNWSSFRWYGTKPTINITNMKHISIVNVNTIHSNMLQWGLPGKLACLSEFSEWNHVSISKPKEHHMPLALRSVVM